MDKKSRYLQIEGNPSLIKDTETKAILNTNTDAYEAFKKRREEERKTRNAINEIDDIKKDVNEIKDMLRLLLTK